LKKTKKKESNLKKKKHQLQNMEKKPGEPPKPDPI
jgi:hypothetical protein